MKAPEIKQSVGASNNAKVELQDNSIIGSHNLTFNDKVLWVQSIQTLQNCGLFRCFVQFLARSIQTLVRHLALLRHLLCKGSDLTMSRKKWKMKMADFTMSPGNPRVDEAIRSHCLNMGLVRLSQTRKTCYPLVNVYITN